MSRKSKLVVFGLLTAVTCVLSSCNGDGQYKGDGVFTDYGIFSATNRYTLNLGEIDLTKRNRHIHRMENLPPVSFVAGLEIQSVAVDKSPNKADFTHTVVSIEVTDEDGNTVIKTSAPLSEWTWATNRADTKSFVYRRENMSAYFTPKANKASSIAVSVRQPLTSTNQYAVTLLLRSGGWK